MRGYKRTPTRTNLSTLCVLTEEADGEMNIQTVGGGPKDDDWAKDLLERFLDGLVRAALDEVAGAYVTLEQAARQVPDPPQALELALKGIDALKLVNKERCT